MSERFHSNQLEWSKMEARIIYRIIMAIAQEAFLFKTFRLSDFKHSAKFLGGVSGPPEAQLIHTLSKFHCLIHELYLTNHHSSQEHVTYGTSCLLPAFLSPTTCRLSNLRSINSILSLYPLSCSLSSFLLCWGFV